MNILQQVGSSPMVDTEQRAGRNPSRKSRSSDLQGSPDEPHSRAYDNSEDMHVVVFH